MTARRPVAGRLPYLLGILAFGCGAPTGPADDLTVRVETERFVFLHAPGDRVDATWQEAYQGWVESELSLQPNRKIEYRKYRDRGHKSRITGTAGNAYAEPSEFRIHTIWPRDNHEVVHVLVNSLVGEGPALFGEGVAVAHQVDPERGPGVPRWSGTPIHDLARTFHLSGQLPTLGSLLTSKEFRAHPDRVTYPSAGSFVRYLLDRRGRAPLWSLLRSAAPDDDADAIRSAFSDAYGVSVDRAWSDWLDFLER